MDDVASTEAATSSTSSSKPAKGDSDAPAQQPKEKKATRRNPSSTQRALGSSVSSAGTTALIFTAASDSCPTTGTPEDKAILEGRHAVHARARESNEARWSGPTRNWKPMRSCS
jgi:hypothetical protein